MPHKSNIVPSSTHHLFFCSAKRDTEKDYVMCEFKLTLLLLCLEVHYVQDNQYWCLDEEEKARKEREKDDGTYIMDKWLGASWISMTAMRTCSFQTAITLFHIFLMLHRTVLSTCYVSRTHQVNKRVMQVSALIHIQCRVWLR